MATNDDLNEIWSDALIRRQIALQGYTTSLSKQINSLLNATENDLAAEIRARLAPIAGEPTHLSPAVTSRLRAIQTAIKQLRGAGMDEAADLWNDQLTQLGVAEASNSKNTLDDLTDDVKFEALLPSAERLASLVTIKPFQGALMKSWAKKLKADDLDRIMKALTLGLTRGDTTEQLVRRVIGTKALNGADGVLNVTRANVRAITSTAINTISNASRSMFFQANTDIFGEEQFVATLDSHTTPICQATDGTVSPVGEGPQPPLHWGCRSIVVALIGDKLAGKRPANGDSVQRVDASTTYQTFLARQSAAFQDKVLGPSRGQLFRAGGLDLKSFVARDGHEFTLDELAEREPAAYKRAGL